MVMQWPVEVEHVDIDNETDRRVWVVDRPATGLRLYFDEMFPGRSRSIVLVVYVYSYESKLPAQLRFEVGR